MGDDNLPLCNEIKNIYFIISLGKGKYNSAIQFLNVSMPKN